VISPQSAKLTRTNKKAEIASAVALLAAIVLVTVYSAIPHYKGVVGLFAIAAIVVSVTVYTKYISPVFFYDITFDGYGVPVFVVRQVIGRRETTLARLSLSEITEIRREDKKERAEHKTAQGFRLYNYCPTLAPEITYRIISVGRYEKSEVIIEAADPYIEMLRGYVKEARENYPTDGEDE